KAPENADFTISTTLGEKRWLNPATRQLHQKFNLAHLFTPSGLHFSSLMFVIGFFVKRRVLRIFIFLSPLLFNSFYSCKRVGLLFGVREVMPKISLYGLFLLVMALDLLFGTFK